MRWVWLGYRRSHHDPKPDSFSLSIFGTNPLFRSSIEQPVAAARRTSALARAVLY